MHNTPSNSRFYLSELNMHTDITFKNCTLNKDKQDSVFSPQRLVKVVFPDKNGDYQSFALLVRANDDGNLIALAEKLTLMEVIDLLNTSPLFGQYEEL